MNELTTMLEAARTDADMARIESMLRPLPFSELFHLLFPFATTFGPAHLASVVAASLLLELEPLCPLTCEDALRLLATGNWELSDKLVPFYLATQFGKKRLFEAVDVVCAEVPAEARERVSGVAYQANRSCVSMLEMYRPARRVVLRMAALEAQRRESEPPK